MYFHATFPPCFSRRNYRTSELCPEPAACRLRCLRNLALIVHQVRAGTLCLREGTTRVEGGAVDAARTSMSLSAAPSVDVPSGVQAGHRGEAAGRGGWWQGWRARFGLAEVVGTVAAIAGFAVGYLAVGSLLAGAGLATVCEAIGFYGCIGAKTAIAACRATAHLAGWRRLAAGIWHA